MKRMDTNDGKIILFDIIVLRNQYQKAQKARQANGSNGWQAQLVENGGDLGLLVARLDVWTLWDSE